MKKDNKEAKETKKNLKDQKTNSDKRIKNSGFIDAWKNAINGIIYATANISPFLSIFNIESLSIFKFSINPPYLTKQIIFKFNIIFIFNRT